MLNKEQGWGEPMPPETFRRFADRFPDLERAWSLLGKAGRQGPLDERLCRLIKLAVAMGAMREGAVHANVRKALAEGVTREEVEQVIALAAGTMGLPSTVAIYTWVEDMFPPK